MKFGVAYAEQANDPADTWRDERCLCVRQDPCTNWHATDKIFARHNLAGSSALDIVMVAKPGSGNVFCDGANGMKELARQKTVELCYEEAKADPDCVMKFGVAYAEQANDPADTWRDERCLCVRQDPCTNWHATDKIFARHNLAASCDDGVQNQGEDGVDCGGPCSCLCIPKYTHYPLKIGANMGKLIMTDDDLIPTDPVCVTNDDWTPPFCRNGKFPQGLAIGIDRCKAACAARPKCGSIAISHPTRGTSAECFLHYKYDDQDPTNQLITYNGLWDFYTIEKVCKKQ